MKCAKIGAMILLIATSELNTDYSCHPPKVVGIIDLASNPQKSDTLVRECHEISILLKKVTF